MNLFFSLPTLLLQTFGTTEQLQDVLQADVSLWYTLFIAFITGIFISFTPCIYPMIPITAGILQTQATKKIWYNFLLALSYAFGVALAYALLGYIVAKTTLIFGEWFSHPAFIIFLLLFFLYFSFSMFGFYEIYIPSFLRSRKTFETKGSLLLTFLFGALSATVTSPCLTPALALMLGYAANLKNPFLAFLILFSFSSGMSLLLIAVGTFSGMTQLLPQSGPWMFEIKKIFGFLLLGAGIYILGPLLQDFFVLILYGLLLMIASFYYLFRKKLCIKT